MENNNNRQAGTIKDLGACLDLMGDTLPRAFVNMMLETNERLARQSASENEREENVCRLLASGMSVEEISLRLKIRADEILIIQYNNEKNKIPEYMRTYKARAKSKSKTNK